MLWPLVSLGNSGVKFNASYGRGRLMAARSSVPKTYTAAGTASTRQNWPLRCQSVTANTAPYTRYTPSTLIFCAYPSARSAAGRARNQSKIA